ncbi:hypothetical protein E3G71_001038 [Mycobacteroides abscessus]|uniref:hypothetical protein n=1 Tax=Mycobacteroides abscessus TaxID=36809 RepID=UPI0018787058|nr:hypothetical protein [Mycobacteroides abscessus]MBE5488537.1 hypothetical protein [Mycobacteroides abscessus]MBE5518133.1 hypothetical protein [Mycobacteroides abscessus]MBN7310960.1 hypothetical protein [Mycobacteroides abscessus subsp. abscessus]
MNKLVPATAALAAALTLTACSQAPESIPAPDSSVAVTVPTLASAPGMDRAAAESALRAGKPFLVALPGDGGGACHTALLVPGDQQPWIMNNPGEAPSEGKVLDRGLAQYGCAGRVTPATGVVDRLTAPIDSDAAVARARDAAAPVIYAVSGDGVTACNTAVALPTGATWFLNRSGEASAAGDPLSQVQNLYGCRTDPSR